MLFKRFLEYRSRIKPLMVVLGGLLIIFALFGGLSDNKFQLFSPIPALENQKSGYEVFGFAPHWKINSLDNVDFSTLTTLAYFGAPINSDGSLDKNDAGYEIFKSEKATQIFTKAHKHGTRVVLTVTQMDNGTIESLLDSPQAQRLAIKETINEVKARGIDGVNIDVEYVGNPGGDYKNRFTKFVSDFNIELHKQVPHGKLTVSVYASSATQKRLYDIASIAKVSDGIFMMAYDFAVKGADQAMPTAPLYGHKEGKYWYDVSTAVDDFLKIMPSEKLILGVPWYGYDYPVYQPAVLAETHRGYSYSYKQWINRYRYVWRTGYSQIPSRVQTYANGMDNIKSAQTGWDNLGKVGWKAYKEGNTWRMFFMEDEKSLGIKYDFAKEKNLGGVGMWALGFDEGRDDMWNLLKEKFGKKLADSRISERKIQ